MGLEWKQTTRPWDRSQPHAAGTQAALDCFQRTDRIMWMVGYDSSFFGSLSSPPVVPAHRPLSPSFTQGLVVLVLN